MTFVEAAIELLKREGAPLSVEILAERAASEGLLERPSKNPLSAMKGRLTTELKRGDDARVIEVESGVFALADDEVAGEEPAEAKDEDEGGRRRRRRRRRRGGGGNGVSAESSESSESAESADDDEEEARDDDDETAGTGRREIEARSPEEAELVELYADETEVATAAERSEYRDELTADEDRQMLPAIKAERRGRRGRPDRGRDRSRGRDRGRKSRSRDKDRGRDRDKGAGKDTERASDDKRRGDDSSPRGESTVAASDLIGQVVEVMSEGSERTMQWAQLAAGLRKRAGRSESTEDLAAMLRRAVLLEETNAARLQIAARVTCKGRDRVTLGSRDATDLHAALSRREDEVRVALTHRLSGLSEKKLEIVAEVYLVRSGYDEIEWVKRVSPSSYAEVVAPGGEPVLVGVRAGAKPVDRRGVGELRAGVAAKNLRTGLLIAPQPLSPAAREELAAGGPPITALCGPPFISALIDAGIGVATRSFTVRSLDDGLFDRL